MNTTPITLARMGTVRMKVFMQGNLHDSCKMTHIVAGHGRQYWAAIPFPKPYRDFACQVQWYPALYTHFLVVQLGTESSNL